MGNKEPEMSKSDTVQAAIQSAVNDAYEHSAKIAEMWNHPDVRELIELAQFLRSKKRFDHE